MNNLITNQERLLNEVIENLIPHTSNLSFLIGYFYFSGFAELNEKLEDKKLRILVGMDIEKDLSNKFKEVALIYEKSKKYNSEKEIREDFFAGLVEIINETDIYDKKINQKIFKMFVGKLKDGSLEVRKTKEKNHSKLYIFEKEEGHNEGGEYPGAIIVGSSNLSYSGLRERREVNVILRDKNYFNEAQTFFNEIWEDSIEILNKDNIDLFNDNIEKKIWIDKLPKPYLLYVRVLDEYFSIIKKESIKLPYSITDMRFYDFDYQSDAVGNALKMIEKHNGVIIADVVGLGKSVIASTVAHNLNIKTIIITPPHLKEQWEEYSELFGLNSNIYTSGSIFKALERHFDSKEKLIIVDEAHKYRNEDTNNYADLHKLCQGNKVILLSATPFNNKPADIFSMVKLFQIPSRSTIRTVDNLYEKFHQVILDYETLQKKGKKNKISDNELKSKIKKISNEIRNLINPFVIRRTRIDLSTIKRYKADLDKQNISFPTVENPILLEYDLGDLSSLYRETLQKLVSEKEKGGFLGARYKSITYLKNFNKYKDKITAEFGDYNLFKQSQVNLAELMKKRLVRRFESSVFAFKCSLENMIKSTETIIQWYEKSKLVPIYKKGDLPDMETILDISSDEIDDFPFDKDFDEIFNEKISNLKEKGLITIPANEFKVAFIEDVKKDLKLLKGIYEQWFKDGIAFDPKLEVFKGIIKKKLTEEPERKIIVFSQFNDTANYLYKMVKDDFAVFKYSSKEANRKNKQIIMKNFDAGYSIDKQTNDYSLLIATDAISEGYNLNRAGAVFNYDIPYNPTRVIQRLGRINRINKKVFNSLYIYNFFPTDIGEKEVRIQTISKLKLSVIQALLGSDVRIFDSKEELQSFFNDEYKTTNEDNEELSWDVEYLNFIEDLRKNAQKRIDKARQIPKRVRIRRKKNFERKGVLIFAKKGKDYIFKFGNNQEIVSLTTQEALGIFKSEIDEKSLSVSEKFEIIYQKIKSQLFEHKEAVRIDKKVSETILKIETLKGKFKEKKDYLDILQYVIKELNALPEKYMKMIRKINNEEGLEYLMNIASKEYLDKIIETANNIDEGTEELIFSEELS